MPEINETPSIDNEIEILANATFGEEVRQAIIDALIKCYTDVIAVVLSGVKKGDSVSNATINSDGELIITILNNETSETRDINCRKVVGDSITDVTIDSDGYMWVTIGNGEPQRLNKCLIGPPGETGHEGHIDVDSTLDHTYQSPRPVTNGAITRAIDDLNNSKVSADYTYSKSESDNKYLTEHQDISGKQNKLSPNKAGKVTVVGNSGAIKATNFSIDDIEISELASQTITTHDKVANYTYSRTESDNTFVKKTQIDEDLDTTSENPVQNKVVAEKFAEFEENYSAPEAALDITSTNAVQNKVITEALNSKVNISDFNNTIFDDIDFVFSNTNGGIYYDGDCPSAPALFIEGESGIPGSPDGRNYYLSYVDSLYDSDDNPHWHRIANISNLITRVIPVDNELSEFSKNPVQNKVIKAALDGKMEYMDESYGPQSLDDINHFTDPNKIYHFYLGLNNINEMVDLIFIINDDEADWDNEIYPYSCQFMLSQSGKIYYRKTDDQGIFGNVKTFNSSVNATAINIFDLPADGSAQADFNAEDIETDNIYNYLADLIEEYPNYISKETMGKDSSNEYDINRYVLFSGRYLAYEKENYPKMYAWKNGSAIAYSISVSPRLGDTMYSTNYIGTSIGVVSNIDNVNESRTVNNIVYVRDKASDVKPTLLYCTSIQDGYGIMPGIISSSLYNSNGTRVGSIATSTTDSQGRQVITYGDGSAGNFTRKPFYDTNSLTEDPNTITIIANEHGPDYDPAEPAIICCRVMRKMCETGGDDFIRFLRSCKVIFVPVANPWGFNTKKYNLVNRYNRSSSYMNYNGRNFHRNFDTKGWTYSGEGSTETEAQAIARNANYAGSEIETQYLMDTMYGSTLGFAIHCMPTTEQSQGSMIIQSENISDDENFKELSAELWGKYQMFLTHSTDCNPNSHSKPSSYAIANCTNGGAMFEMNRRIRWNKPAHDSKILRADYQEMAGVIKIFAKQADIWVEGAGYPDGDEVDW